jgi:hypothetical protein
VHGRVLAFVKSSENRESLRFGLYKNHIATGSAPSLGFLGSAIFCFLGICRLLHASSNKSSGDAVPASLPCETQSNVGLVNTNMLYIKIPSCGSISLVLSAKGEL